MIYLLMMTSRLKLSRAKKFRVFFFIRFLQKMKYYLPTLPLTFRLAPFGSTKVNSTKTSAIVGVEAGEATFANVAAVDDDRSWRVFSD